MPIQSTLSSRTPVHIWTRDIEPEAEQQLRKLSELPFLYRHVAVMPDVHAGRGSTVGTVIATKGAIIPAAVGVDIGCGMMAVKTSLRASDLQFILPDIRRRIEAAIPVGFDQNRNVDGRVRSLSFWNAWDHLTPSISKDTGLRSKAMAQCGSLGGGNHFIEVCLEEGGGDPAVWIMLHSGSRNIGKVLADVHINKAKGLMRSSLVKLRDPELAYLSEQTPDFKSYMHDLHWAQEYALNNREEMMRRVLWIFEEIFGEKFSTSTSVNCHHNYTREEDHFGQRVWVTRKGAVNAERGRLGIVPGSMGTRSYIVRGLGNPDSFNSCSHGAGRRMSRTQAKRSFTRTDLEQQTLGVECRKDSGVIDEIPGAYKDIDRVMQDQSDLVEVVTQIKQVLCVKG